MKTMDSKQEILSYAVYMIGGSYFNKTRSEDAQTTERETA